jgi:hypothetical protein
MKKLLFVLPIFILFLSCNKSAYTNKEIAEKNYLYSMNTDSVSGTKIYGSFFFGTGNINSKVELKRYCEFYYITKKNQIAYMCFPMEQVKIQLINTDKPYFTFYLGLSSYNNYIILYIREDQIINKSLVFNLGDKK